MKGVGLFEAIESGKPFRRPGDKHFWIVNAAGYVREESQEFNCYNTLPLSLDNLYAKDYIIKESFMVDYETFYQVLNSDKLCPNTGRGVAIDIRAAWSILTTLVKEQK